MLDAVSLYQLRVFIAAAEEGSFSAAGRKLRRAQSLVSQAVANLEAHEMAIQRMVQAGAVPITWMVFGSELQRDWARTATVPALAQTLVDHSGVVGTSFKWEQQLLATPPATTSTR